MDRRKFLGASLAGLAAIAAAPIFPNGNKTEEIGHLSQNITERDNVYYRSVMSTTGPNRNDDIFSFNDGESGEYTKKLMSLMKEVMHRNGEAAKGAAKATSNLSNGLSDLWISPEAYEDIKNWGCDQIDETTRKEILSGPSEIKHLHSASISVSSNLERDEILELGRRGHYHRYVNFPVEVEIPKENHVSDAVDYIVENCGDDADWSVLERAMDIMREGFEKKINNDGWGKIKNA
jgi:hypothetical protein